ncbi:MAG: 30S ribosomal protein S4 [Candidatus Micrarchaeota archaeon]|nr:30S ribosomal protein S4 [Candidatus Micrarchaeota archaeon]MDE1824292.1 30S ribosomal protein S4 [Candidatus Micrarchaeota archaeon]MDE1849761.1 30S ribosomal protein S4 [Candidatus Micrarchaeota archaeon]
MGDPKKIRKKFERPKLMWNTERITRDHGLRDRYGLKNLRELWKVSTEVSRIRRNVREVLSGRSSEKVGTSIRDRLARYSVINKEATLDDMLNITPEALLDRRLQSLVFKKGLAKTPKQARQLITHGFIAVNGQKVKSPGYLVSMDEENKIGYYKSINLDFNVVAPQTVTTAPGQGPATDETPKAE